MMSDVSGNDDADHKYVNVGARQCRQEAEGTTRRNGGRGKRRPSAVDSAGHLHVQLRNWHHPLPVRHSELSHEVRLVDVRRPETRHPLLRGRGQGRHQRLHRKQRVEPSRSSGREARPVLRGAWCSICGPSVLRDSSARGCLLQVHPGTAVRLAFRPHPRHLLASTGISCQNDAR